jgi:UTP--glucose-1-phosphate uridylyltransferase
MTDSHPEAPFEDAVIIAAGRGTRMRPTTRAVPKEFLPNFDRPLIQSAIEEAITCGARRITIVTSDRSEPFLRTYFAPLDAEEAADPRLDSLRAILESVEVRWVRQPEPRGTGNATLYARDASVDRPFLLILPDMVFPGNSPGLGLRDAVRRFGGSAISVTTVGPEYYDAWGIVTGDPLEPGLMRMRDILEKPGAAYTAPEGAGINGRYVLTPGIFDAIEEVQRAGKTVRGEVNLTDAMVILAAREPFHAVTYHGAFFDSGHAEGYLAAAVATALADPDHRDGVRAALRPLLD